MKMKTMINLFLRRADRAKKSVIKVSTDPKLLVLTLIIILGNDKFTVK